MKAARAQMQSKEKMALIERITTGFETKLLMIEYNKMDGDENQTNVFATNEDIENFNNWSPESFCLIWYNQYILGISNAREPRFNRQREDHHDNNDTIDLFNNWDQIGQNKSVSLFCISDRIVWMKTYLESSCESFLDEKKN